MNNLFVLHTQYNLLLTIGMCLTDFCKDKNDLILFTDFNITEKHKRCIAQVFSRSMVLGGNYPIINLIPKQKIEKMKSDNKAIKKFAHIPYDRLFVVDDMCIQEMFTMKCVVENNSDVVLYWLEDGTNAYFDNGVISGGMGATSFKRWLRKTVFSTLFGLGKYYDLGPCMGSHYLLKSGYFMFPNAVRKELWNHERNLISDNTFMLGMQELFGGEPINFEEDAVLIAMDKLDVYGSLLPKINDFVTELVNDATKTGKRVYYKYHPRETRQLESLAGCEELERTVALENFLTNSTTKNITVVGFKSTALQTAKKMGYKSISYIKQLEPNNTGILQFYESIGIECK